MSDGVSLENLMSGLFLGACEGDQGGRVFDSSDGCARIVNLVQEKAQESCVKRRKMRVDHDNNEDDQQYDSDDELEPAERWHQCLTAVRAEWEVWKSERPSLYPWFRKSGHESDNRLHLESVLIRLGDVWRARDHLLGVLTADRVEGDDVSDGTPRFVTSQDCDLCPMALFMLTVVRAEELEAEGLRVTRSVRAKYGDAGLPNGLEGLLGGQRSLQWWLRETDALSRSMQEEVGGD